MSIVLEKTGSRKTNLQLAFIMKRIYILLVKLKIKIFLKRDLEMCLKDVNLRRV